MNKPDVLRVCFFTVQDIPMLAVGHQEADRLRVVKLLEGEEAEQVYRKLTEIEGSEQHAAENKTPPASADGRGNPEL